MNKTIVGGLQISPELKGSRQLRLKLWTHDVNNHQFELYFKTSTDLSVIEEIKSIKSRIDRLEKGGE